MIGTHNSEIHKWIKSNKFTKKIDWYTSREASKIVLKKKKVVIFGTISTSHPEIGCNAVKADTDLASGLYGATSARNVIRARY